MNNINIRPYQTGDRAALRTLCCDVADRGLPIEHFFSDREVAADLLTKYYTDYEPESTFVAICNGRLVGYINGCTDNRRYGCGRDCVWAVDSENDFYIGRKNEISCVVVKPAFGFRLR